MATMESLIGLVNKIQRACTVLGDHGGEGMSLWEALPSVAVVGGQVLFFSILMPILLCLLFYHANASVYISNFCRVLGNPLYWKALLVGISCPVDLVIHCFLKNLDCIFF